MTGTRPDEQRSPTSTGDYRAILSGTSQNVLGIVVAALATFGAQVLMTRTLGADGFGIVTVVTQAAFVLSFATRAGMDMAVLRDVAVEAGAGSYARIRVPVARATAIGTTVSTIVAVAAVAFSGAIRGVFSIDAAAGRWVIEAAAVGLPFLALANIWLSATRGLKIMRYTLYVFWVGQPLVWIVFMVIGWQLSTSAWMTTLTYSLSWAWAAAAAFFFWRKESTGWQRAPMEAGAMTRLLRYAGPRAPAALFSQLLFWADLFVLSHFASAVERGVYAAALRAGQILVLFLTSVSLMFSPYVADLHARGESRRLDGLFKALTRWTLAATLPLFLLLAAAPEPVLRIFGAEFSGGQAALLILLAGQFVNVATGSVGFVLIMVGRTGWDLVVYAGSLVLDLVLAIWLAARYGMEGAAIANAVTFAVSKWVRLALVRRFVNIQPYDRHYVRLVPPAAAGGITMWLVHAVAPGTWFVDLLLTATAGFTVYALVYLLVGLTPPERARVRSVIPIGPREDPL